MARESLELCMKFEVEEDEWKRLLESTNNVIEDVKRRVGDAEIEFLRFKTPLDAVYESGVGFRAAVDNANTTAELLELVINLAHHNGQFAALLPFYNESEASLNRLKEILSLSEIDLFEINADLANLRTEFANAINQLRQYPEIPVTNFLELAFVKNNTTSEPVYVFPFTPQGNITT